VTGLFVPWVKKFPIFKQRKVTNAVYPRVNGNMQKGHLKTEKKSCTALLLKEEIGIDSNRAD